jgi:Tol biopolymer transport system component
MSEEKTQSKPSSLPWMAALILLTVGSVAVVGMVVHDAVTVIAAGARNATPTSLFSWLPSHWYNPAGEPNRYLSLFLQLLLLIAAIVLPFFNIVAAWVLRRRAAFSAKWLSFAAVMFVFGAGADAVLFKMLAARPKGVDVTATGRKGDIFGHLTKTEKTDEGKSPPDVVVVRKSESEPPDDDPENNNEDRPTLKPDGQAVAPSSADSTPKVEKIVFASNREGETYDIWMMNPDGSNQERVFAQAGRRQQPRFSRDGRKVTYVSSKGDKHFVTVADWLTKEEKEVCEGIQGSFTPDGEGVVFIRSGEVFLRNLKTNQEKLLSPPNWPKKCAYPTMSPDGKIVAVANRPLAGYNIDFLSLEGGEPRQFLHNQGTCDPRWSPTGRFLSYQTESHIYSIRPDGTDKCPLTFGGGVQHYATWSPDEKRIAFCQGPGPNGPWQICTVSTSEDEDPIQITKEGSNIYPDWGLAPVPEKQ